MGEPTIWIIVGFLFAELAFASSLLISAGRFRAHEWRRTEAEHRLRPLALAFLEGSAVEIGDLTLHEGRALAGLLAAYGERLSGSSRKRLAALFEQEGRVASEVVTLQNARHGRDRRASAGALGDLGSPTATEALTGALLDDDPGLRAAAARSLGQIGAAQSADPLLRAFGDRRLPRIVVGQAIAAIGAAALPALSRFASDADPRVRQICAELIGTIGGGAEVVVAIGKTRGGSHAPLLMNLLDDPEPSVRAAAAWSLGRLGTRLSGAAVAKRLADPSTLVRTSAAEALGRLGERDAVVTLLELAEDEETDLAVTAAIAAAQLDPLTLVSAAGTQGAVPPLREAADLLALGLLP